MADIVGNTPAGYRFRTLLRLHFLLAWRPSKTGKLAENIGKGVFILLFAFLGLLLCGIAFTMTYGISDPRTQVEVAVGGGAWAGASIPACFSTCPCRPVRFSFPVSWPGWRGRFCFHPRDFSWDAASPWRHPVRRFGR
ncbi:MAG: hypothetical protein P8Z49_10260 [Acidobacteriota bacterium]